MPLPKNCPTAFAYVSETVPGAVLEVRYYGENNFVGQRVDGYLAPRVILTTEAATALAQVESQLAVFGLGIKVFDGYRPQQAVDHFVRWGRPSTTPNEGAVLPGRGQEEPVQGRVHRRKSGHSRGSTVDLTIIDLKTKAELDMGTPFDFFGPKSWPSNKDMPAHVRANRALLQNAMLRNGFKPLTEEWWHFTLRDEPYPDTYFNFPVQ